MQYERVRNHFFFWVALYNEGTIRDRLVKPYILQAQIHMYYHVSQDATNSTSNESLRHSVIPCQSLITLINDSMSHETLMWVYSMR